MMKIVTVYKAIMIIMEYYSNVRNVLINAQNGIIFNIYTMIKIIFLYNYIKVNIYLSKY